MENKYSSNPLTLEEIDTNLYRSADNLWRPVAARAVYGGQVVGQALSAAGHTKRDNVHVHSLHCYFVSPGDPNVPIIYHVERVRDGKSFCTRSVTALQKGKAILTMMVSYQKTEYMPIENQFIMPEAPPPEKLMNIENLLRSFLRRSDLSDSRRDYVTKVLAQEMPIEMKPVDPFIYYKMVPNAQPETLLWIRVRANLDEEDRNLHRCAAAYISDFALLRTALVPFPRFKMTFGASLDHSMWFHSPFRADDWMLYECKSPRLVANRALIYGRLWKRDGTLAVSVAQEALIRGELYKKNSKL